MLRRGERLRDPLLAQPKQPRRERRLERLRRERRTRLPEEPLEVLALRRETGLAGLAGLPERLPERLSPRPWLLACPREDERRVRAMAANATEWPTMREAGTC